MSTSPSWVRSPSGRVALFALLFAALGVPLSCGEPAHPSSSTAHTPTATPPKSAAALSVTRFVAFGDSLTVAPTVPPGTAYPAVLQALMAARYPGQRIAVANRGHSGEMAGVGLVRLPGVLEADKPEVVLLMEGTNNLPDREEGIRRAAEALTAMIRLCRNAGVRVLLATVPPQKPGARRGTFAEYVPALNVQIRRTAAEQGVVLVDVAAAMGDDFTLLDPDGLHPSETGCRKIAETFLAAVQREFETTSGLNQM